MAMTSTPSPSPSSPPSLQAPLNSSSPSSSNPWNRNPSAALAAPLMGEPSSWPPLPSSSSQIHAAVSTTAMASAVQIPAETPSPEAIDPPSTPAPIPASPEPSSDPLPVSAPEPDPVFLQEPTALLEEFDAAPRPSAPPRRGPNPGAPNHQRSRNHHNNRRPQHGRGSRGHFFAGGNGRNFNRLPPPNWNPGFGFGPMWPPHQLMGAPPGVPLPNGPPLNYYDVSLPQVCIPLPPYGGSFYPEPNGPFYHFPFLPPRALSPGTAPAGLHPPLQPTPPPNEDPKGAYKNLLAELRWQIEYYFSDDNLVKDEFLKKQMDDEGWVDIQMIAKFNKVAAKTTDLNVIREALSSSVSVELHDDKLRKKDGWARYCIPRN